MKISTPEKPKITKEKSTNKPFFNKNNLKKKVLKNKITKKNNIKLKEENNNIIFEFRNERLLQGRNISNNVEEKKRG